MCIRDSIHTAFNGHHDVVQALLSEPTINVDMKSDQGFTALHAAAFKGYPDLVKEFLAKGANVNNGNIYNWTPLIVASFSGKKEVVEILLQEPDTDIDFRAFIAADDEGHVEVVDTLLAAENLRH